MPDVLFKNLARDNPGFDQLVQNFFGWTARRDGDNWLVDSNTMTRQPACEEVLELLPEVEIAGDLTAVADRLIPYLSTIYDRAPQAQQKIGIAGGFGLTTDVQEAVWLFSMGTPGQRRNVLSTKLLPLMRDQFGATRVSVLKIHANRMQAAISFFKIALLLSRHSLADAQAAAKSPF